MASKAIACKDQGELF